MNSGKQVRSRQGRLIAKQQLSPRGEVRISEPSNIEAKQTLSLKQAFEPSGVLNVV